MQILEEVSALSKYRIKYTKGEEARYISHLDFVRTIGRTFKRAEIPVDYSKGFNPHIILTVGLPCSVGALSQCEYLDTQLYEDMDCAEIIRRINNHIPMGLKVTDCRKLEDGYVPLHKIESALYKATIEYTGKINIDEFMKNSEIIVDKKTKKGVNPTDIRPMIYDIEKISDEDGVMVIKMHLSAGEKNLKPETVFDAMEKYYEGFKVEFSDLVREKIFFGKNIEIMN